jgi:hypothetical protein
MRFKKTHSSFLLLVTCAKLFSQGFSAYTDYKNYFYVFDNGKSTQLEYLPVQWYKLGSSTLAYLDNSNTLKAYYKGQKIVLSENPPTDCIVNDNMIITFSGKIVYVFENGITTPLAGWSSNCIVGDSIVGCVDQNTNSYKIFYDGQIHFLPDVIDNSSLTSFCAGDNILAYKNAEGYLKIYYRNRVFNTEAFQPAQYKAGANTVAFINESTQEFTVFQKGIVTVLETQAPVSFQVADDMVAYIDVNQNFKVFYNGKKTDLASFTPEFYNASDNILVYADNTSFNAFYKGKTLRLGRIAPKDYKIDLSTLAYLNEQGFLNVFSEGRADQVGSEKINIYQLSGNTVKFSNSLNEPHFFVNSKYY